MGCDIFGHNCDAIRALDIIAGTPRLMQVDIFMDCQAAIIALTSPKSQSRQYLLTTFHVLLTRLLRVWCTLQIKLHWVPVLYHP
ncbi:hypothetical protein K438DRAFT_1982384 [Mycena galopus ATCC 62051]|nr:hypothetical protein K438DRAFT_1982384 [Mycena galopus ATCC 62051]